MGSNASIMLQQEDLQNICQQTGSFPLDSFRFDSIRFVRLGFTVKQVQRLYSRFKTLDKRDCGYLTREDLLCIPEVKVHFEFFFVMKLISLIR